MNKFFEIDDRIENLSEHAHQNCAEQFADIERISQYNGQKVLSAFIRHGVSEACFKGTTGYGYDDLGRERLERVFADCMGAEDALVRHTFMSGTHTLATALFGILRPGDVITCVTGTPYDTLQATLGLTEGNSGQGSLADFGVEYRQLELTAQSQPDYEGIVEAAVGSKVIYIQRSRGYSLRPSLHINQIEQIVGAAKSANPQVIVMVDNCYGEFVEKKEPCDVGADLVAGSLIKNPGGGIATTGGYIAGRADLIELCGYRMTCPGVGREVGCTQDQLRSMYLGLFFAPTVVESALKTATFAARLFEDLGFEVTPRPYENRTDIIQAIKLATPERLCAFCRGIQSGSPIDSFAAPQPGDMPGYDSKVIMAAGAFTMGASIELSADAPLREPYAVWLQGGITYPSGRMGVMLAAQSMVNEGLI